MVFFHNGILKFSKFVDGEVVLVLMHLDQAKELVNIFSKLGVVVHECLLLNSKIPIASLFSSELILEVPDLLIGVL